MWDQLWTNVRVAEATPNGDGFQILEQAALAIEQGRIQWIGLERELPGEPSQCARAHHVGGGRLLTPGLIDCHTHLIFGGDRSLDFDLRTQGQDYAAISAAGGGIRSTVQHTRDQSPEALCELALPRARALLADGVTTLEIKSGYGLNLGTELNMLKAAHLLADRLHVNLQPTLLALHALPPEFANDRARYVDEVIQEWIPAVVEQKLAVAVDVFIEHIAFSYAECARVLAAARDAGLAVKVHADQLSDLNGAALAAEFGALSADHLEYTNAAGVSAVARSGTVAVLLPGAFLMLNESTRPPIAAFRAEQVPMAIATDLNPGTSPLTSLTLAATLARAQFGLTAAEAFAGITVHAAKALGLARTHGRLAVGQSADFCLWDAKHPRELTYWLGRPLCHTTVQAGRVRVPLSDHPPLSTSTSA